MKPEELQELETLRAEKRARVQQERAAAALNAAGVPEGFALLLTGGDDAETDARVQQFCCLYQTALAQDVSRRLPEKPPAMTASVQEQAAPWETNRETMGIRIIR